MADETSPMADNVREREYIEIITSLRHYSTLRFSVISVFYAVTAALAVGAMGIPVVEGVAFTGASALLFKCLGVLVTIILFFYEYMIDGYQVAFRKYLQTIWPESHWFRRPSYGLFFQAPIWMLYWGVLGFWVISVIFDATLADVVRSL